MCLKRPIPVNILHSGGGAIYLLLCAVLLYSVLSYSFNINHIQYDHISDQSEANSRSHRFVYNGNHQDDVFRNIETPNTVTDGRDQNNNKIILYRNNTQPLQSSQNGKTQKEIDKYFNDYNKAKTKSDMKKQQNFQKNTDTIHTYITQSQGLTLFQQIPYEKQKTSYKPIYMRKRFPYPAPSKKLITKDKQKQNNQSLNPSITNVPNIQGYSRANVIIGQSNRLKGSNNLLKGSFNSIKGSNNLVLATSRNIIYGSGNLVTNIPSSIYDQQFKSYISSSIQSPLQIGRLIQNLRRT